MAWIQYNPNPAGWDGIDCTVRALTKALDISWEEAYTLLSANGFSMCDMPNANHVFNATLRQKGFQRFIIPNSCPDCYTMEDFANDHPEGIFILSCGDHVCTIVDGNWYDSWNSGRKVGIFYWAKEDEKKEG